MSMSEEIKDSRITDALANRRSVIIVGRATIAAKLALFESLLANLPESARLGVIDESGALAEIPENATVIDAKLKGPSMRRGDIVRMLMDVSGQENGQVLMINGNIDDATQTLTSDLPMILLKSSPSGHTEFSDAAIKAMNPVVIELSADDSIRTVTEVDLHAEGLNTIDVR